MLAILLFVLAGEPVLAGLSPERAVKVARDALARELRVSGRRIQARDVRRAEWPDASLGCPEKGMQYAQVVTAGYAMRLEVDGKSYSMHVAGDRAIRCDAAALASGKGLRSEEVLAVVRLQRLAREDLARRLEVAPRDVRARSVRPATGALDCPAPAASAEGPRKPPVGGWIVELEAGGRSYRYHADGERVTPCGEPAG